MNDNTIPLLCIEALARVPPLLLDLEALARELRANRATRPEGRRTTPMLPPSMPPPAQLADQDVEGAESERKTIETPPPAAGFDDDDERTKLVESEELRALRKQSAQRLAQTHGGPR